MSTEVIERVVEGSQDLAPRIGTPITLPRGFPWSRTLACLVALDLGVAVLGGLIGVQLRFGYRTGEVQSLPYIVLLGTLPLVWSLTLLLGGGYDRRFLVTGSDEFRRVLNAGIWLLAAIGFLDFVTRAELSRAVIGMAVPLVIVLTLVARFGARIVIQRRVVAGQPLHRVVVLGSTADVQEVVGHIRRCPHAGYDVVGACLDTGANTVDIPGGAIPVLGTAAEAGEAAQRVRADTVAVAGTGVLRPHDLRRLSWRLEGTGIRLVVAPAITDVAGPRIVVRPVAGLPLLHVEEPEFTGARRVLKGAVDRCAATALALLLAPLLLAIAVSIRLTSPGPAIYRQVRVGINGRRFVMWKFRTMQDGADGIDLAHLNEKDGPLFKMRRDPRTTPVGQWLRRYSLDELPQLWNVINGSMSLVGPRPPVPAEVETYPSDVRRRLLVKPGVTGLWQVSGRSDLSWEESVRLDLYYIENWSVGMDVMLLLKTFTAVLSGQGAY